MLIWFHHLRYIKIRHGCQPGLLSVKILSTQHPSFFTLYRMILVAHPSTSGENVSLMLFYLLKGRTDQFTAQKFRYQRPDEIRQIGLVTV